MKICFLSHTPELGGAERSLFTLVRSLRDEHAVEPHVFVGEGPLRERFRGAGIPTIPIQFPRWTYVGEPRSSEREESVRHAFRVKSSALADRALRQIDRIGPDWLYTQTLTLPQGCLLAKTTGLPHAIAIREYGLLDHRLNFLWGFEASLRFLCESSRLVLASSPHLMRSILPEEFHARTVSNYGLVRGEELSSALADEPRKATRPLILNLATIHPAKGQLEIVRAAARLRDRGLDFEVAFAGASTDPAYRKLLDAEVASLSLGGQVRFLGHVDDPSALRRQASVVVTASMYEAFGRAPAEALLAAKALVYTRSGSHADFIEDGVSGLSYEAGNDQDLAEKLTRVLSDAELRARLEKAGPAQIEDFFRRHPYARVTHEAFQQASGLTADAAKSAIPLTDLGGLPTRKSGSTAELRSFLDADSSLARLLKRALRLLGAQR